MISKTLAVTSKAFSTNPFLVEELKKHFAEIRFQTNPKGLTPEELIVFLKDVEYAIIGLDKIDAEVLDACPKLKGIAKYGVGLDNIDQLSCQSRNIKVGWSGGVNRLSVAEMTIGLMLGLCRNLFLTSSKMRNGEWHKNGGFQLTGKTIGIIGAGHIGKEVIRLIQPFQCKILVNDLIPLTGFENADVTNCSKNEIYKNADVITLHVPYTQETKNLINYANLKLMKKEAILINTSRGGIVNEIDLLKALNEELIKAAALDVFMVEPLDKPELYEHERVVATPHIGGNSQEAVTAMGLSAIENLLKLQALSS